MKSISDPMLDSTEELQLLQLLQLQSWAEKNVQGTDANSASKGTTAISVPSVWSLLGDVRLHPWQQQAAERWFGTGGKGIIKVVTGAGKTILALAIAERLQRTVPNLRVAIIVPTIVLLEQWRDQLLAHSNLSPSMIGTLGGGSDGQFDHCTQILICVLNSAAKKLPELVRKAEIGENLLLIVDECHRAGAAEMRRVFDTPSAYTLGLSATPERDDDPDELLEPNSTIKKTNEAFESILERQLGSTVFELNYVDAIRDGILPAFKIEHYALSLDRDEAYEYNALSQEITDLRRQLETGSRRGLALIRWCRSAAGTQDARARRLISLTVERKQLLYGMRQRLKAVERLVEDILRENPRSRIIIFHESISEVMRLFNHLRKRGYFAVAEHSELPDRIRAQAISFFRRGTAQIIVSAKSLIEGFNVPSADVGIIVAASSSVRQRIQTLGRLLRKTDEPRHAKNARLIVFYAAKTVDEIIYEKADWNTFVGAERNEYFEWTDVETENAQRLLGPPRLYVPSDTELDVNSLTPGEKYPGKLEGKPYSINVNGTVYDEEDHPIAIGPDLQPKLHEFVGGGRFLVTSKRLYMVKLPRHSTGGLPIYLGQLNQMPTPESLGAVSAEVSLVPGSEYPLRLATGTTYSVLQRDARLIARKRKGTVTFVRSADHEPDKEKQARLASIQEMLKKVYGRGHRISKIFVNELGHVGYLYEGRAYFVGLAPEGSNGFMFDG